MLMASLFVGWCYVRDYALWITIELYQSISCVVEHSVEEIL
jgi:hypothetical protein